MLASPGRPAGPLDDYTVEAKVDGRRAMVGVGEAEW